MYKEFVQSLLSAGERTSSPPDHSLQLPRLARRKLGGDSPTRKRDNGSRIDRAAG
jgi:hypothetical protein